MPIEIQQLVVEPMPSDLRPQATMPPPEPPGSQPTSELEHVVAASVRARAVHRLRLRAD
jgi:hypothetical protein